MALKLIAVSLFSIAAAAAPAVAVTIDFDTLPNGDPVASGTDIDNQYSSLGVTFDLIEGGVSQGAALASSNFGAVGTGNGLWNSIDAGISQTDANRTDILRIEFLSDVDNVSFVTEGFTDITTFEAYDRAGNLLETITNTTGGQITVAFFASNISRVDALQGVDDFTYVIDDLSFDASATVIPVPAALPTLMLGLAAFGFFRRRGVEAG